MHLSSYSDVFAIRHERFVAEGIEPGDKVRSGDNLFPHFDVIAVHGDTVWARDTNTGVDHLAPLSRCRQDFRGRLTAGATRRARDPSDRWPRRP